MNFFPFIIFMGVMFLLQIYLTTFQIKDFNKNYGTLRKNGKVAIGRCAGKLRAGVIVMFSLDDNGYITDGALMQGVTFLARFKKFGNYNKMHIKEIANININANADKMLKKAIKDVVNNYITINNGDEISDIPSPFMKLKNIVTKD